MSEQYRVQVPGMDADEWNDVGTFSDGPTGKQDAMRLALQQSFEDRHDFVRVIKRRMVALYLGGKQIGGRGYEKP